MDDRVQQQRDEKLRQYTQGLDRLAEVVDFAALAASVDAACPRPDRSLKGGRPPYPTLLMVKVLVLQALYNLSDEATEHHLLDRRSFQRFCDVTERLDLPDARTIWLFKQRLTMGGLGGEALFDAVQQQLQAHGYIPRGGQMVDATIVRAPIQHVSKEEKAQIDEGRVPEEWKPRKRQHKDLDARWTKKHGKSFFGYKLHTNVDARYKLIRRCRVTPANVDDGKTLPEVTDAGNTAAALYADRGYDHGANHALVAEQGWRDGIAKKARPKQPLGPRARARNRTINRTRSRVEHVFGPLEHLGRKVVRAVTLARNELALKVKCAVYNLQRLVWLEGHVVAA